MVPNVLESRKITSLPITSIRPNPNQPRRQFDQAALAELADSIQRYGILQPLTVRRAGPGGFELVAGERRLRAAKMAGLKHVPCIFVNVDERDSGLLALVENLQRRDLDYIEEAEGLRSLIRAYGLSQEEAARCISKSQSAVANKLRLLKLSPDILFTLREQGLSERHARALLRLDTEEARLDTLRHILANDLTVAKTEDYVEARLRAEAAGLPAPGEKAPTRKKKTPAIVLKDVRIFLNTVTRGLSIMNRAGLAAVCDRMETDKDLVLTIRIPKSAN